MYTLVLLRHGESIWNKENRFSGWVDVGLSEKGVQEAKEAAKSLKENGFTFDLAYTSYLKRAIKTLWIVLEEMDLMHLEVRDSWKLNERHYGALQGLNKSETAKEHGEGQVLIWRRSYNIRPPEVSNDSEYYPANDERYAGIDKKELPRSECLKDTVKRVLPYWEDEIIPEIRKKKKILISAHGNSLRALVKILDKIDDEDVIKLNIPTGIPLIYELDKSLKPIRSYYLAEDEKVNAALKTVEDQGKKND